MDISFLTPVDALFALAAVVPLAALLLAHRRASEVWQALSLAAPRARAVAPVVVSLALLPALLGVAAAQPVVVRERQLSQRADAQAYFVFDTSLSMSARAGLHATSRLERAKREALRLVPSLGDLPVGLASMTDRTLPDLMPTTDPALFSRTLAASVGINTPPPSQSYRGRATTLEALVPILQAHFFASSTRHKLIVVFTDGESSKLPPVLRYQVQKLPGVTTLFVHVWATGERIFKPGGRPDPGYTADPTSGDALASFAGLVGGKEFSEQQLGRVAAAAQDGVGHSGTERRVETYARIALAPWFLLAGVVPLGFLLWRRNL